MKITLTGWNGFLATKLKEHTEIEWVEHPTESPTLLLMGSPTFTNSELTEHDAQVMHQYVRETIRIVDRFHGHIIFASTTGVNDIQLDHKGSTCYNLSKLYLENYIINNCDHWAILRIGTVISTNTSDINMMKPDRIQPRIKRNDLSNIKLHDDYLLVDDFVNTTLSLIKDFKPGIVTYPTTKFSLSELIKI